MPVARGPQLRLALLPALAWWLIALGGPPPAAAADTEAQGRCGPREPLVLVYNRVAKSGSSSVNAVIEKLAPHNNFTVVLGPFFDHEWVKDKVKSLVAAGQRAVVDSHFFFPDLGYDHDTVGYINIVREPVSRCRSQYYYARYSKERPQERRLEYLQEHGDLPLDECVAQSDSAVSPCLNCGPLLLNYLCGPEHDACHTADFESAAGLAWANVQQHYVAGPTDALPQVVELLEKVYPSFFRGATQLFTALPRQNVGPSSQHPPATQESTDKMHRWLAPDIDLYHKISRNFQEMYQECIRQGT